MKSFYIILMSLIISSTIFPQENSKKQNNYALSFGIAGNFTLDKFNGEIAVKKIIDDTHQLRLFLSPRIFTKNDEMNSFNSNNNITVTQDNEIRNYSIGVGADYLWTLITSEDINMFGGTGLVFTYGNNNFKVTSKSKSTSNVNDNNKFINETNNPFTNIGIRGTLGVEWKVTDKIGIHSEYLFTGSYNWSKSEIKSSRNDIDNPTKTRTASGISLGSGVLFGISIYF